MIFLATHCALQLGMFPSRLYYRLFGKRAGIICSTADCAFLTICNNNIAFMSTVTGLGAAALLVASHM